MMTARKKQPTAITLKQLMDGLCVSDYLPDIEISGLAIDSRKVKPGYAFIALEGQREHGLAFAEAALNQGAVVVICDARFDQYCQQILSRIMSKVICVPVHNLQHKLGEIANKFYDSASHKVFVCGITGTDGKTTVSHFIAQTLQQAEGGAAVIGTIGNGPLEKMEQATHTTPDVISLHEMIRDYYQQGVKSISMEVSSHGLDQQRVAAIDFDVAVLTNLSRDHLDYHGSIEAYRESKKKLFTEADSHALVINADDAFGMELYEELKNGKQIWLYGLHKDRARQSELYAWAENIETEVQGLRFRLCSSQGTAELSVQLIGEFNIYNLLACFCVLMQKGINFNHAIRYLEKLSAVTGRMELITLTDLPAVVIDFAHTPAALSEALKNVRKHVKARLICVFGCGGDRDAGKRPLMAQAAEAQADLLIITSDNPRTENPAQIIEQIEQGISDKQKVLIEVDREKAIQQAIQQANVDDIVLIAGKGHEQYQLLGDRKIPFSDRAVALKYLAKDTLDQSGVDK